ncbi:MAG: hypothetical protein Cons2KO_32640 [Congregibacter sp.]
MGQPQSALQLPICRTRTVTDDDESGRRFSRMVKYVACGFLDYIGGSERNNAE